MSGNLTLKINARTSACVFNFCTMWHYFVDSNYVITSARYFIILKRRSVKRAIHKNSMHWILISMPFVKTKCRKKNPICPKISDDALTGREKVVKPKAFTKNSETFTLHWYCYHNSKIYLLLIDSGFAEISVYVSLLESYYTRIYH